MKDTDKIKEFIELRAKNWSFKRISEEIGVSKPTLIEWSKKFRYEIETLNNIELEGLFHEYKTTTEQRMEYYGELQNKILTELKGRDMSEVKTDKLLEMLIKTSDKLFDEATSYHLTFKTGEEMEQSKSHDKYLDSLTLI